MKNVYAFKNNDEELNISSSGGAYIGLCNSFENKYINNKLAFYGVKFDDNLDIVYGRTDTAKNCKAFQGSKYVKSNIGRTFLIIENDLKDKRHVLFSGIPCQIASLKSYLKNKNISDENLICIDLICHGTPETRVWEDYKKWLENKTNSTLIKYSFRYKREGWKAYPAYAEFENKKKMINTAETSVFSKLHLKGLSISKGCFKCPFSNENRQGDITIGDYWGIEKIDSKFPNKKGVSLIIANSQKGNDLVRLLEKDNQNSILKKTETDEYLKYQHNLKEQTKKPAKYEEFWKDYNEKGFEYILKKHLNYGKKYKINFNIKKIIRKTPLIKLYRSIKSH